MAALSGAWVLMFVITDYAELIEAKHELDLHAPGIEVMIDDRNFPDVALTKRHGITYRGIGR